MRENVVKIAKKRYVFMETQETPFQNIYDLNAKHLCFECKT